jgi:uncharacterized protein (UPF0332 family)/predicted nucleotidyltransferase
MTMMPTAAKDRLLDDPMLERIAKALRDAFGPRLVSALLFGSRARGDHQAESDYDVAVFLDGYERTHDRAILDRVRQSLGHDALSLQFRTSSKDGLAERTTLMFNIRREGVPLPGIAWPEVVAPPTAPHEEPTRPETRVLLDKSERWLANARTIRNAGVNTSAARDAYYAALYAARAFIFEERDLAPKTHSGTVTLFNDAAVRTGKMDEDLAAALSRGGHMRMDIDDEPIPTTTEQEAAAYVDRAAAFVAAVNKLLSK